MFNSKNTSYLFYGALLSGIVFLLSSTSNIAQINYLITDFLYGEIEVNEEIIILQIDKETLDSVDEWPWDRRVFSSLISKLDSPSVVGIETLLIEPRSGDSELNDFILNANFPIIFGSKVVNSQEIKSIFAIENTSGYVNLIPDTDNKVRKIKAFGSSSCNLSFAANIYLTHLNDKTNCENFNILQELEGKNQTLYFRYTKEDFEKISVSKILNEEIDPKYFYNKIVLIGATGLDDTSNIGSYYNQVNGGNISGVEIQANIINSFISNNFLTPVPSEYYYAFLVSISIIFLGLFRFIRNNNTKWIILFTTLFLIIVGGIIATRFGLILPIIQPAIIVISIFLFQTIFQHQEEKSYKNFIKQVFGQYVNRQLLEEVVDNPDKLKLGGEKRNMTVLFSDIRGFTSLSEELSAEELVELLNEYLEIMTKVVFKHNGTIDKYIGDAIMAFWNAPLEDLDHQTNAIHAALDMAEKLEKLNKNSTIRSSLEIGIGINTGEMVVGNIGSTNRVDYTVLGDSVNLGSRVESLTKKYGVNILVTEAAIEGLSHSNGIIYRFVDKVIVKGKNKSIKIFQPMRNTPKNRDIKDLYEKAYDLYKSVKFNEAVEIFDSLGDDGPSRAIVERISNIEVDISESIDTWKWDEK